MSSRIVDAMLPFFRTTLDRQLAAEGLKMPREMQEQIEAIVADESERLPVLMMPETIDIYAQVLSLEELEALRAFYRTPAGASVMQKIPLLTQAIVPSLTREPTTLGPILERRLADEILAPALG